MQKLLIDGEFIESEEGKVSEIHNPANFTQTVDQVFTGTKDDVKKAIDSASLAFRTWSETPARTRAQVLAKAADLLTSSETEIAELLTREQGKPLPEALNELRLSAVMLRYYAGLAPLIPERRVGLTDPNEFGLVLKKPVGICAAITPWNSPVILMVVKIAPALAAGNTMVIKPASSTPLADLSVCGLINKAGLPKGTLNVVTGPGSTVGEELISNPKVAKIAFTGETETGKRVMSIASQGVKRVSLELGGSDPMIVCKDADFAKAIDAALINRFRNCGQVCMSVKRLYVEEEIFDSFLQKLIERIQRIKIGDGLIPGTKMGPLHSKVQRDKIRSQVEEALESGARIEYGGNPPAGDGYSNGYFFQPTLVTGASHDSKIVKDEVFGPVLPVIPFKNLEEAIELSNDSVFGLGSSIWTRDLDTAMKAADKIAAGTTWINSFHEPQIDLPFGGVKESGLGREMAIEGLENYLEPKAVVVNPLGKQRPWLD
jgi:acyl-CoA reductase-like NAD-dependent aldehyde dehydrogenase